MRQGRQENCQHGRLRTSTVLVAASAAGGAVAVPLNTCTVKLTAAASELVHAVNTFSCSSRGTV
jgi:hypothetical protein